LPELQLVYMNPIEGEERLTWEKFSETVGEDMVISDNYISRLTTIRIPVFNGA